MTDVETPPDDVATARTRGAKIAARAREGKIAEADAVVAAIDPGLNTPGVETRDAVLVAGPWLAGSTSVMAALRERMPQTTFVESTELVAGEAPAAVVFVVSAAASITEIGRAHV